MNIIMKDQANKSWVRSYREPTEPKKAIDRHAKGAVIGMVAMFLGVMLMICAVILALNSPKSLAEVDDCYE